MALSGRGLTPGMLDAIAREHVPVVDQPTDALDRIRAAQQTGSTAPSRRARPVYGVTTGLGPRVTTRIDPAGDGEHALRTLRGRAVCVGEPLPREVVRAAMAARLNGLCAGGSGAGEAAPQTLAAMLNAGVHPVVPRHGSIGASDLCLLAHVGLVVAGEGEAELDGRRHARRRGAGRPPASRRPGCGSRTAWRCAAPRRSRPAPRRSRSSAAAGCWSGSQSAAALSMEGFRASLTPIDPRVVAARPAPGQEWAAAGLRERLAGGSLTEPGAARRLQDPLSFRCAAPIHGSLHVALDLLEAAIEPELNGAGDNPLVLAADDLILSTGNFHTPAIALAADGVAIAIAQVAAPAAERIGRLCNAVAQRPAGQPHHRARRLGRDGAAAEAGPRAGQLRSATPAAPLSIDPSVTAEGVEDDATNAALAVLRLTDQLDLLAHLIAIELVCAAQAVDLAAPARLGDGTGRCTRGCASRSSRSTTTARSAPTSSGSRR